MTFEVRKASLLRDSLFLFITVALLLGILVERELQLWQGLLMIVIYIIYIAWVMGYHRWISWHSNTEETAHPSYSEDEDAATPTEERPLLPTSHPHRKYNGEIYRHHRTPGRRRRLARKRPHARIGPASIEPSLGVARDGTSRVLL